MSDPIHLHLPASWETWRQLTEEDLEPAETRDVFAGRTALVWLPGSTHVELTQAAQQAGWSYGQLLGYLVIQGILRAAELAQLRGEYNPHYPDCPAFYGDRLATCVCARLTRE
jgi:hypothetical protein